MGSPLGSKGMGLPEKSVRDRSVECPGSSTSSPANRSGRAGDPLGIAGTDDLTTLRASAAVRALKSQSECLKLRVRRSVGYRFTIGGLTMKISLGLVVFVGMSVWFPPVRQLRSHEDADETAADDPLQAVKEVLEQSVDWYDILPDAEAKVGLRPQIVLSWRNAVRRRTGAAILAIWTDQGRPDAMASIFQIGEDICHEFGSLSRSKIVVRDNTRVVWSPGNAGVDFRDLPDAPAPAEDRAVRLRQMMSLAGRFTARLPDGELEVLRLLPTPLYRYELKDSKDTSPKLRDGAMFAFVMGTDPEVVLLLEAVEREEKAVWQYAFARATAYAVEASLGDEVVWSVQSGPKPPNVMQIFHPIGRKEQKT